MGVVRLSEDFVRWIVNENEFDSIFLKAQDCVFIDSRRDPTALKCLQFVDGEILTRFFASLMFEMMARANDKNAYYIVLRPDPIHYFHRHFGKYPVLEIGTTDTVESYLAGLNEGPGGSPSDALNTNWWTCVIMPSSMTWFVHVMRSEENGGHLWVPEQWVPWLMELHPGLRPKKL